MADESTNDESLAPTQPSLSLQSDGRQDDAPPKSTPASAPRTRGPQRIVVLCDGTWQKRRSVKSVVTGGGVYTGTSEKWFTNVALLGRCIESSASVQSASTVARRSNPDEPDSVPFPCDDYIMPQVVFYQDGIGATQYLIPKLFEGATGSSLDLKVQEAYSFVADNYLPGDELFFFGFSRGAYTARTLAAFINYVGILSRDENAAFLPQIWSAFRNRDPSDPETVLEAEVLVYKLLGRWPSKNAMCTAQTNMEAAKTLVAQGIGSLTPEGAQGIELKQVKQVQSAAATVKGKVRSFKPCARPSTFDDFDERTPAIEPPTIQVVGVWDTVGALGIPAFFPNPQKAQYFSFFDPMLAPNVRHAFHALALFEDRKDFLPTIWSLPKEERPQDAQRRKGQQLKQCWFQGSHSDVGGGHPWHGLSDITFAWMVAQLVDQEKGPLLHVNLKRARKLQDFRLPWSRQPQHPSRAPIELQGTRYVAGWSIPSSIDKQAIWHDMVDRSSTHESIHHSVVVGRQYSTSSSPQFNLLRTHGKKCKHSKKDGATKGDLESATSALQGRLDKMWKEASDPASLSKTEVLLRWTDDESALSLGAHQNPKTRLADVPLRDNELPPSKPDRWSARAWKVFVAICYSPLLALSLVVNWNAVVFGWKPLPQQNLEPPLVLRLVQKFDKRPQEPSEPISA